MKMIGIIGDSIAHGFYDETDLGWVARLGRMIKQKYGPDYFFNNMAQSGDNIADAVHRAETEVLSRPLHLIIVNIGINDLRRRKNSNEQLDFSEGLRIVYWQKLLDILQKTGAEIVVTDLLPIIGKRYAFEASLVRRAEDVVRYNEIIAEICRQRNIRFLERYAEWQKLDLDNLYYDATHPNAKGHQLLAEQMFDYLNKQHLL